MSLSRLGRATSITTSISERPMQEELSADYLKFRARQTISNLDSSLSTYGQKWLCDRIGEKSRGNQKPKRATQVIQIQDILDQEPIGGKIGRHSGGHPCGGWYDLDR